MHPLTVHAGEAKFHMEVGRRLKGEKLYRSIAVQLGCPSTSFKLMNGDNVFSKDDMIEDITHLTLIVISNKKKTTTHKFIIDTGENKLYLSGTENARVSAFYEVCESVLNLKKGTFKLLDSNGKLIPKDERIGTRTTMRLAM